jgi:hypothetical protein
LSDRIATLLTMGLLPDQQRWWIRPILLDVKVRNQQLSKETAANDKDVPIADARAKAALIPIRAAKSMTGLYGWMNLVCCSTTEG